MPARSDHVDPPAIVQTGELIFIGAPGPLTLGAPDPLRRFHDRGHP